MAHELHKAIGEGQNPVRVVSSGWCDNFDQLKCAGCHGHEQAVTDRLHLTVFGYTFQNSNGCYSCHLTGGASIRPRRHHQQLRPLPQRR